MLLDIERESSQEAKMKKGLRWLIAAAMIIAVLSCMTVAQASETDLDWSKPIRVRMVSYDDNNLFTVQSGEETFKVSMIGVDIVDSYTITKVKTKNGKTET